MGTYKPFKIKLSNNTASGMYLLTNEDEIKYDKDGNTRPPKGRAYKIQIEVEAIYNNSRKRGKKSYSVPLGTSIIKAVQSLQGKKNEMINALKTKGTLKTEKIVITTIKQTDGDFQTCWLSYYETQLATDKIKKSTYDLYKTTLDTYLKPLHKKSVNEITIRDVQSIINNALSNKKAPATISRIKPTIKPLLEHYDVILNWKKLIEPKIDNERKYKKSKEVTKKIINALLNYEHPQIKAIFHFSLTGRRISEILALKYENINWAENTYKIPKENVKTRKDIEFQLTPPLIEAIKSRGKIKKEGLVFSLKSKWVLVHFKRAMANLDIYDLHLHDLRSLVAQTALDNGANIYDVSALLAHSNIATTEKRYVDKNKDHAQKALDKFLSATALLEEEIIDVDVLEDKFAAIKNLYPHATNEKIQKAMEILEG
ncbi:tyrosine-type recombinase/integrase [Poseidonibacter ostreae]|uniref:Tyrosine-type recombinase/integrase n=1 Tax=Poseidonibacter ostreae TaxID=2654171 RepID=A0A6L4WXL6_9BACT|nr:tyrosine-type recombinase/integrase [Poseidonibacter ostreae]KAB7890184.1 tyrosine-type recombinase/integrase [Poseidonibacter ostreae]